MTRQRIQRTKRVSQRVPQITKSGKSQVNRSFLQRVMENPTQENLTPSVVQQLQTTHGNQVVNRLMRQAKENSSNTTPNITQKQSETVQRKYEPENKSSARKRTKYFNAQQAGKPLAEAFDIAYDSVNKMNKLNNYYIEWRDNGRTASGITNALKRGRFSAYNSPDDVLNSGNKSDIADMMQMANSHYFGNEIVFQQAVLAYKGSASANAFHDLMEKYIYQGADLQANVASDHRLALVERAYRMLENELDDNGNPQLDTDFFSNDTAFSQNPLYTGN